MGRQTIGRVNEKTDRGDRREALTCDFTVVGNQIDRAGNPIPKVKLTKRQYWTPQAQRYAAWKMFVQNRLLASMTGAPRDEASRNIVARGRPIILKVGERARMDIAIKWAGKAHPDPENVFGSIADALFLNDKDLDGSFTSMQSSDHIGKVRVSIKVCESSEPLPYPTRSLALPRIAEKSDTPSRGRRRPIIAY